MKHFIQCLAHSTNLIDVNFHKSNSVTDMWGIRRLQLHPVLNKHLGAVRFSCSLNGQFSIELSCTF